MIVEEEDSIGEEEEEDQMYFDRVRTKEEPQPVADISFFIPYYCSLIVFLRTLYVLRETHLHLLSWCVPFALLTVWV